MTQRVTDKKKAKYGVGKDEVKGFSDRKQKPFEKLCKGSWFYFLGKVYIWFFGYFSHW